MIDPASWLWPLAAALLGAAVMWLIRRQRAPTGPKNPLAPTPPPDPWQDDDRAVHQLLIEHTRDVILRLDSHWPCRFVSPSCHALFGYEVHELVARPPFDLVYPEDRDVLRAVFLSLGPDKPGRQASWRGVHRNGEMRWIEASYHHIAADGGILAILSDVTRQKQTEGRLDDANTRLERLARIDSLTGLPNRAAFLDTVDRAAGTNAPLAVMFIDLDRFRLINDIHGHAAGDAVLRETAARLSHELAAEPIVARLGADAFAALLRVPDGDPGLAARARDLIRAIAAPIRIGAATVEAGVAIGIAVSPRDGHDAGTLTRAASLAMTHAKQRGGGAYRFHEPAMGEALERAAALTAELRMALTRGEIVPWFQPLVRLADMEIVGFEVLARWDHPRLGVLGPEAFLPLAEDMGAQPDVFATLLTAACQAAQAWPSHLGLSVNISPHELRNESLAADVERILTATGFDGTRLEIEITEHALIQDLAQARAVLDKVRDLGVSLALDDFGTGFSSLHHLRELPFDKLKIDRSLLRGLDTDHDSARFVAAIVVLGQALGLEVTAEGVEDEATLARVRELGCTYAQGYLFGRPAPAATVFRIAPSMRAPDGGRTA